MFLSIVQYCNSVLLLVGFDANRFSSVVFGVRVWTMDVTGGEIVSIFNLNVGEVS